MKIPVLWDVAMPLEKLPSFMQPAVHYRGHISSPETAAPQSISTLQSHISRHVLWCVLHDVRDEAEETVERETHDTP